MDKRETNFAARFELGLQRHLDALSSIHSFHHAVGSTLDVDSSPWFAQIEFTRHLINEVARGLILGVQNGHPEWPRTVTIFL